MPTRQPVTFEMVTKWNIIFKQIQQDLNECTCISALISLFARHGRALTGVSPEHAQIVGSV